jgi:hypothetical protein
MITATTASSEVTTYTFDGEGRRVKKSVQPPAVSPIQTVYVYDAMGQLAAEYGTATGESGTRYLTGDHLGSTRLITRQDGTVDKTHGYRPFGEEIAGPGRR